MSNLRAEAAGQNLESMSEGARIHRFHAHLGDFSACVCDALKEGEDSDSPLKRPWTAIVEALDQEDKKVAVSGASKHTTRRLKNPMRDAIKRPLSAIRTYARRNFVAHGNTFGLYRPGNYAGLAQYLDEVDKTLEGVLPGVERIKVDMYRRLLTFYMDRHIQLVGTDWVTADQRDNQPKATSTAESCTKEDKSPYEELVERLRGVHEVLAAIRITRLEYAR